MRLLDECFGGFGCSRVWPLSFFLVLFLFCLGFGVSGRGVLWCVCGVGGGW